MVVEKSVFRGNTAAQDGSGAALDVGVHRGGVEIKRCLFERNEGVYKGAASGRIPGRSSWSWYRGSLLGRETDREADPQFCDPDLGDLRLSDFSPCLPAYSLGCGLIGALDHG